MMQEVPKTAAGQKKKEYVRPKLTDFGPLVRLSQSGASTGLENGPHPTFTMAPCL
jgi:hypothetical protein